MLAGSQHQLGKSRAEEYKTNQLTLMSNSNCVKQQHIAVLLPQSSAPLAASKATG
jgi:hypothetical protein